MPYKRKSNSYDSAIKARKKWNSENLDRINLVMPKGKKERIKEAAAAAGDSVNGYINKAIDKALGE